MNIVKARFLTLATLCLALVSLPQRAAAAEPMTANQVAAKALKGAVFIRGSSDKGSWTGSGFLVDTARRLIVTNHHVTNNQPTVLVYFPAYRDGELVREKTYYRTTDRAIRGRVLDSDATRDLAVVQLDSLPEGVEALPLAEESPGDAERVHLVGNPGASQAMWAYSTGHVRAVYRAKRYFAARGILPEMTIHAYVVESDMPMNGGDSGAPVLNDRGEVVAVNSYSDEGESISRHIDQREVKYLLGEAIALMSPKTATARNYHARAERLSERELYDAAIADYTAAIRLDDAFAAAYRDRGYAYYLKEDYARAVADCTRAIELDPKDHHGYNQRGLAYRYLKEYDKSIADHTRAIELSPEDENLYLNRAASYLDKEEYDESIKDATEALRLNPDSKSAYLARGKALYWSGTYDKALADFDRAGALAKAEHTLDANVFYWMGAAFEALGANQQAAVMFGRMIEMDPGSADWLEVFEERFLQVLNKTDKTVHVSIQYLTFTDRNEWKWFNTDGKAYWTVEPGQTINPTHDDWRIRAQRIRVSFYDPAAKKWLPAQEQVLAAGPYRGVKRQSFTLNIVP
jgi:tetratricopeptide (TPR) repeat protein